MIYMIGNRPHSLVSILLILSILSNCLFSQASLTGGLLTLTP